jgi:hypothetical protein
MTTPFTPFPDSATDRVQRGQDQADPAEFLEELPAVKLDAIPVLEVIADEGIYRTLTLQASGVRQCLPQDPQRYRAVIIANDNAVVLCATKELAQDAANTASSQPYPTGMYLATGQPGVEIRNKGLMYVANTSTSGTTRVSVLVEKYANP